jgi:hypothetical protein
LGVAGAAGAAGACSCEDDIICEPGFVVSQDPAKCCRCVLDCLSVGCVEVDCPEGSHAIQEDDACCPSCVLDQPLSCDEAREKYDYLRTLLLADAGSVLCTTDEDCSRFEEDNRCSVTCGTAVPVAELDAIEEQLSDFAEHSCTNCPKQQPIPCGRPFPARCVDGACQ